MLHDFSVVLFASFGIGFVTCVDLPRVTLLSSMENFYKEPTLETLNSFKKKELSDIAGHYGLEVPENASKADIKKIVLDHLVEEELISEPDPSDTMRGQHLLELKRLEYQERDLERETQLKMKELEIKEKEIAETTRTGGPPNWPNAYTYRGVNGF